MRVSLWIFQIFTSATCIRDTGRRCERAIRRRHSRYREILLSRKELQSDIGCRVIRNPPTSKASKETSCPALLFPTPSLSSRLPLYWIALDVSSPVFACISRSQTIPPPRLRLVLYVFLKVDKSDAIASFLAENFLGKYARVRHSLEPLDTRRSRLSRSSPVSFWSRTTDRTEAVEISERSQQRKRKS